MIGGDWPSIVCWVALLGNTLKIALVIVNIPNAVLGYCDNHAKNQNNTSQVLVHNLKNVCKYSWGGGNVLIRLNW